MGTVKVANGMLSVDRARISGNFGPKLNALVRSNRKSFEITGPPFEVDHFFRSDRSEFWMNGSRPVMLAWVTCVFRSRYRANVGASKPKKWRKKVGKEETFPSPPPLIFLFFFRRKSVTWSKTIHSFCWHEVKQLNFTAKQFEGRESGLSETNHNDYQLVEFWLLV